MKKLNRKQMDGMVLKPMGRASKARAFVMALEPGEGMLLERADWEAKVVGPTRMLRDVEKKTGRKYSCAVVVDGSGWVIERLV